jgi:hypothetical protein
VRFVLVDEWVPRSTRDTSCGTHFFIKTGPYYLGSSDYASLMPCPDYLGSSDYAYIMPCSDYLAMFTQLEK